MTVYVRKTQQKDLDHLGPNLRDADVTELYAQTGLKPYMALHLALLLCKRMKTMVAPDGTPIGVYGVTDTDKIGLGNIWMMATPDLLKHQRQFLRECREGISEISQGYKCVYNYTHAQNTLHHEWLKWCGFTFINEHKNYGRDGETFYEFAKIL